MKSKFLKALYLVFMTMLMASCSMLDSGSSTYTESDLIGLWQETGTQLFIRFTTEKDSTAEYKYGREWDEGDDVHESDLKPYGNGWFKWKLVTASLTEIHLMDNGGAQIPKVYTVTALTSTTLSYKDDYQKTHTFAKVVTAK